MVISNPELEPAEFCECSIGVGDSAKELIGIFFGDFTVLFLAFAMTWDTVGELWKVDEVDAPSAEH